MKSFRREEMNELKSKGENMESSLTVIKDFFEVELGLLYDLMNCV